MSGVIPTDPNISLLKGGGDAAPPIIEMRGGGHSGIIPTNSDISLLSGGGGAAPPIIEMKGGGGDLIPTNSDVSLLSGGGGAAPPIVEMRGGALDVPESYRKGGYRESLLVGGDAPVIKMKGGNENDYGITLEEFNAVNRGIFTSYEAFLSELKDCSTIANLEKVRCDTVRKILMEIIRYRLSQYKEDCDIQQDFVEGALEGEKAKFNSGLEVTPEADANADAVSKKDLYEEPRTPEDIYNELRDRVDEIRNRLFEEEAETKTRPSRDRLDEIRQRTRAVADKISDIISLGRNRIDEIRSREAAAAAEAAIGGRDRIDEIRSREAAAAEAAIGGRDRVDEIRSREAAAAEAAIGGRDRVDEIRSREAAAAAEAAIGGRDRVDEIRSRIIGRIQANAEDRRQRLDELRVRGNQLDQEDQVPSRNRLDEMRSRVVQLMAIIPESRDRLEEIRSRITQILDSGEITRDHLNEIRSRVTQFVQDVESQARDRIDELRSRGRALLDTIGSSRDHLDMFRQHARDGFARHQIAGLLPIAQGATVAARNSAEEAAIAAAEAGSIDEAVTASEEAATAAQRAQQQQQAFVQLEDEARIYQGRMEDYLQRSFDLNIEILLAAANAIIETANTFDIIIGGIATEAASAVAIAPANAEDGVRPLLEVLEQLATQSQETVSGIGVPVRDVDSETYLRRLIIFLPQLNQLKDGLNNLRRTAMQNFTQINTIISDERLRLAAEAERQRLEAAAAAAEAVRRAEAAAAAAAAEAERQRIQIARGRGAAAAAAAEAVRRAEAAAAAAAAEAERQRIQIARGRGAAAAAAAEAVRRAEAARYRQQIQALRAQLQAATGGPITNERMRAVLETARRRRLAAIPALPPQPPRRGFFRTMSNRIGFPPTQAGRTRRAANQQERANYQRAEAERLAQIDQINQQFDALIARLAAP